MSVPKLDYLFNPQSVAVVGVSLDDSRFNSGRAYFLSLVESGFKGKLYPVNPSGGETRGFKVYPSVRDIPDNVDYVISAIPAEYTTQLVADCAAKRVKAIHFFTAGFSEIEDQLGERLEAELVEITKKNGIRIIGPNCMGIYCPKAGLSFSREFPGQLAFSGQTGPLGFMAQSGTNSIFCIDEAANRGVYFSKAISYGNAADLNESDFLEYLGDDPDTKIIAAYIEGVKDGPRFAKTLRKVAALKPVIIFKAGITESGTRAASSHTGSIAGSTRIWSTLLNQAGAIEVHSIEEIVDVAQLFLLAKPPSGKNTAIIGMGGGPSVQATDDCVNAGLAVPAFPLEVRQKLVESFHTVAGRIFRNPVDIPFKAITTTVQIIAASDEIDLVIIHIPFDGWSLVDRRDFVNPAVETILEVRGVTAKPVVIVFHCQATELAKELGAKAHSRLNEAGFSIFPSISRAAAAIKRFIDYQAQQQAEG